MIIISEHSQGHKSHDFTLYLIWEPIHHCFFKQLLIFRNAPYFASLVGERWRCPYVYEKEFNDLKMGKKVALQNFFKKIGLLQIHLSCFNSINALFYHAHLINALYHVYSLLAIRNKNDFLNQQSIKGFF